MKRKTIRLHRFVMAAVAGLGLATAGHAQSLGGTVSGNVNGAVHGAVHGALGGRLPASRQVPGMDANLSAGAQAGSSGSAGGAVLHERADRAPATTGLDNALVRISPAGAINMNAQGTAEASTGPDRAVARMATHARDNPARVDGLTSVETAGTRQARIGGEVSATGAASPGGEQGRAAQGHGHNAADLAASGAAEADGEAATQTSADGATGDGTVRAGTDSRAAARARARHQ